MSALEAMLRRLDEVNMSARPTKCVLGNESAEFLGHIVAEGKLLPQNDKIEKICDASIPTTQRELQGFLGLAGYYRKFIPGYAEIALPLTDKTRKGNTTRVEWDPRCDESFNTLKTQLCTKPVLVLPDSSKEFILRTDASGKGLGAVLLQDHGQGRQPVAYASKKLSPAEQHYHIVELECLAVVWGIRKFYPYLFGRHFVVETDHHPLQYIDRLRPISKRLMGWAVELQSHDFSVQTIKGKDNLGADYLSRTFDSSGSVQKQN